MTAGLAGTGRVADDLYLMAHDDVTGRPLLQQRGQDLGLAAGLLAELMLHGCTSLLGDGTFTVRRDLRRDQLPRDDLARRVLDQIACEHHLPARDWLEFLGLTAADDVAARLERAGYLTPGRRRLITRAPRWAPVDPNWALAALVRAARARTEHEAVLGGLAVACGLQFRMQQYVTTRGDTEETTARLGPGLRELIAQTQAAADSSVLARRA